MCRTLGSIHSSTHTRQIISDVRGLVTYNLKVKKLVMVGHACNPFSLEAEAGERELKIEDIPHAPF
jgi:hypothetical protein